LIIGNQIIRLKEVDSTNDYLKSFKTSNIAFEGLVVVAQNQKKGRGQMGNEWLAEPDKNLTFSVLLMPKLTINYSFVLSMLTSLVIIEFLRSIGLNSPLIKWPNDIYYHQKKMAGILIENTIKKEVISESIIGVGININQTQFESLNATSVGLVLNKTIDLEAALLKLLKLFDATYLKFKQQQNFKSIKQEYLRNIMGFNTKLNFTDKNGDSFTAKIIDVEWNCRLVLETNQKEIRKYFFKEVEFKI
jgi:BirA family biotin operon repressor/biotin-[acetyl-CoA-carboxylase] ligase